MLWEHGFLEQIKVVTTVWAWPNDWKLFALNVILPPILIAWPLVSLWQFAVFILLPKADQVQQAGQEQQAEPVQQAGPEQQTEPVQQVRQEQQAEPVQLNKTNEPGMFMSSRMTWFLAVMIIIVLPGYKDYKNEKMKGTLYQYVLATDGDSRTIAEARESVVTIRTNRGHGSGFVVSDKGLILTNEHVVSNVGKCSIERLEGKVFEGKVLIKDRSRDVALISSPNISLQPLKIRENPSNIGEEVFAIGTPKELPGTVTKGIISNKIKMGNEVWLQGDAAVNPGNSGGPLLDAKGNVIGISSLQHPDAQGIFFYAPIMDALARLKIQEKKPAKWYNPRTWYRWFL
jgi:S1-C subfamily serine protease